MGLRGFLDSLPTPVRVALWLGFSSAVTAVYNGISNGDIKIDPALAMYVNLGLVVAREIGDALGPKVKTLFTS